LRKGLSDLSGSLSELTHGRLALLADHRMDQYLAEVNAL
ncbi:MAG: hypothetical protein JWR69_94, partial [Pedosphaera sp.]|nr:hypothetical protein [Pedosphaera sp.]